MVMMFGRLSSVMLMVSVLAHGMASRMALTEVQMSSVMLMVSVSATEMVSRMARTKG
jgi:hypothetical protein